MTCVQSKIVNSINVVSSHRQMCSTTISLYLSYCNQSNKRCRSMVFCQHRRKLWFTEKPFDRIPTRWKIVIAGLIGSGTGLLILTMWRPGSADQQSSSPNQLSKLTSRNQLFEGTRITKSDEEKSSIYCQIYGCSTITCSMIPELMDPGKIASDFISRFFTIQCPTTSSIERLTFEACNFPNNSLKNNWLISNLSIDKLTFRNCALTEIPKGTFDSSIFNNLKTLEIITGKIRVFKKWIFEELSNLKNLRIDDNIIHEVEYDLLQPIADSIEVLELDGCLKDAKVLLNITNASILSKVQIMSIQRNVLSKISSKMFKSIPNLNSLYLGNSEIENCDVDLFNNIRSLEQLDLKNNLLKNLPDGIFSTLLNKPDFRVWMMNNPWNCTCEFQWIQNMIKNHPKILTEIPKCETPETNAFLYFTNAEFCQNTTTETTEEIIEEVTESTASDEDSKFLKFTCQNRATTEIKRISRRKLLDIEEWEFASKFQDFFLTTLEGGKILVNLPNLQSSVSLIWFKSPDIEGIRADSINCVQHVLGPYVLTDIEEGYSYTVCLLKELDKAPSPFNCLAIRTDPLPWSDTWLTTEDKIIVFSASITLIIIVSIISVLSSFLVIRRNPSLLRGSKRIVMVRKRDVKALVLPEGVRMAQNEAKDHLDQKWFSQTGKKMSDGYLTPLEFRKCADDPSPKGFGRKDSKASRMSSQSSGGSYVSGIEPTPMEIAYWRNIRKVRNYSTCIEDKENEEPPPLPPLPSHRQHIPSLSLAIEKNQIQI